MSAYLDGLVVHRREEELPAFTADDREFKELTELARELSALKFREPEDFRNDLRDQLPSLADSGSANHGWLTSARTFSRKAGTWMFQRTEWISPLRSAVHTAATMTPLVVLVAAFVWQMAGTRTASAAEILSRADMALAQLVHHGQVLHRRWKVTDRIRPGNQRPEIVREYIAKEWMDGSDFSRVAGSREANGLVYLAYARARENGEVRPRVYFAPGFFNEPRGLLSVEPSHREFQEALTSFGPQDREKLQTYLDRGYIFEPISGERRFNRIVLESSTERNAALPRVVVSLREETLPSGTEVYAVRIVDPARVQFLWRSEGAPVAWLQWHETVRYIARDTYLTLKAEETYQNENGRRVVTTRELLETRIVENSATSVDPFVLTVPEGTPVRRQSAVDQLSAVAAVMARIPEKLSR